jgi:hypothetical protein
MLGAWVTVDVGARVGSGAVGAAGVSARPSAVGLVIITVFGSAIDPVPQDWSKTLSIISQLIKTISLDFIYPPNIVAAQAG